MKTLILFFIYVYCLNTAQAAGPLCQSLFSHKTNNQTQLIPFKQLRAQRQPWDIAEHGLIVDIQSKNGTSEVKDLMSLRDGTYPLIIDNSGHLVIDHRLPNVDVGINEPYVGNHRGLYQKLESYIKTKPEVIFAGQIRVVAGLAMTLVDQSGTFYSEAKDLREGEPSLVYANQKRLDYATKVLLDLQLITEHTQVINFMKDYGSYKPEDRNEGHVRAQYAANFERQCRANPSCWSLFQRIDSRLKILGALGSKKAIMEDLKKYLDFKDPSTYEYIQMWSMILSEGAIDILSYNKFQNHNAEANRILQHFLERLDEHYPLSKL